jgi:hypothetical protein
VFPAFFVFVIHGPSKKQNTENGTDKTCRPADNQAIITRHPVQDQMSIGEKSRFHQQPGGRLTGIFNASFCNQDVEPCTTCGSIRWL